MRGSPSEKSASEFRAKTVAFTDQSTMADMGLYPNNDKDNSVLPEFNTIS